MSKNLSQVFAINPITTIGNTDLLYVSVGGTTDGGISGLSLKSLFASSALSSGNILVGNASNVATSVAMSGDATLSNAGVLTIGTLSHALNMGSHQINNVSTPVAANDAVNKAYADTIAGGFNPIQGVYAASTANLAGYTYSNGAAGIGATLTAGSTGVFTVDGQTPAVGTRFLYKDDSTYTGTANGIYTVTTSAGGSAAVLTRATDYNTPNQINPGDLISVEHGTVNAGTSWYETATIVTIGVTAIAFSAFFQPANFLQTTNNLSDLNSASTARTNLGVAIGSNVQAWSAVLDTVTAGTYTGASSIVTLGTIATGTWQGSLVAGTYGGTGVNNGASTITIGGNVTFSGAHTFTGTLTNNTSVTFPTSGTLSTTTGTVTSIATGFGLSGGTITSTGTIRQAVATSASVYANTVTTTLPHGAVTKVKFDTKEWDLGGYFDIATNYRYTPLIAGIYSVNILVTVTSAETTAVGDLVILEKNGTLYKDGVQISANANAGIGSALSCLIEMNGTTDYFEVFYFNGSSGTDAVTTAGQRFTYCDVCLLAPSS